MFSEIEIDYDKRVELENAKSYFDGGITHLEKFITTSKLRYLNKTFRIEKWNIVSKFLFYIAAFGSILIILHLFGLLTWYVVWFYAYFVIILCGFLFTTPGRNYNIGLVIGIFSFLIFVPSFYGQATLNIASLDVTEVPDLIEDLYQSPINDVSEYISNFMNLLNWIVFIGMVVMGGGTVANIISQNYGEAAQKISTILLAIAIMTVIYGIFLGADVGIIPIWETVGGAWDNMLNGFGLSLGLTLDVGDSTTTPKTIVNGLFELFPMILIIALFGIAFFMRHDDFKSMLFAKEITKENYIKVKVTSFSIGVAILLFVSGIYVIGYFLITADPEIVVNPYITLSFYIFAVITMILIGNGFLILNKEMSIAKAIKNTINWTIYGMIGLWLWFQVFSPVAYQMGINDQETGLISLSQDSQYGGVFLEQLFLVAMPETLIFQIFIIGLGNRIWFYFKRTRILQAEENRLYIKAEKLREKLEDIIILEDNISKKNLRNISKAVSIEKKIIFIEQEIKTKTFEHVTQSSFVISTLISSLIGSFFFSWYHSFRRGINFVTWWQNPQLGMVYFGAGFFLCLVSFFSFPAAILVHALNNTIAVIMYS